MFTRRNHSIFTRNMCFYIILYWKFVEKFKFFQTYSKTFKNHSSKLFTQEFVLWNCVSSSLKNLFFINFPKKFPKLNRKFREKVFKNNFFFSKTPKIFIFFALFLLKILWEPIQNFFFLLVFKRFFRNKVEKCWKMQFSTFSSRVSEKWNFLELILQ